MCTIQWLEWKLNKQKIIMENEKKWIKNEMKARTKEQGGMLLQFLATLEHSMTSRVCEVFTNVFPAISS